MNKQQDTSSNMPVPLARCDRTLGRVTADAVSDTISFYEAAGARGATVVVPPTSTAYVSRHGLRSSACDRTILAVKEIGRRRWKVSAEHKNGVLTVRLPFREEAKPRAINVEVAA